MKELDLISTLETLDEPGRALRGDDCGELAWTAPSLLASSDMLIDGVHFLSHIHSPEQIARKSLGVNVSDIAAMAGTPQAVLLSLALNRDDPPGFAEAFLKSFSKFCSEAQIVLLGGDTNFTSSKTVISVTILGTPHPSGSIRRSGARVGDLIFVSGPLGGSLKSDRHLSPPNRSKLAQSLGGLGGVRSMIDLSDGLATDLRHILKASKCGAIVYADKIPLHSDALNLESAFIDGEDYELLFTACPTFQCQISNLNCVEIGIITPQENSFLLSNPDGTTKECTLKGFEHG
jgi:thiamine-monophosphate kinase